MSNQRVSSYGSSSSSASWKYDVFLNFRSEDTGKNFTDHLYAALDREGFRLFKGEKEYEREMPISLELEKTIEESRISVVVFSKSYAFSIQCLDELVKILECMHIMGQTVIPIFYDVEPDEPRYQEGVFQEAFANHEEHFEMDAEKVQMWRKTLKEVSNLSGFHLQDRYEAEFIEGVVQEISSKLRGSTSKLMNLRKLVAGVNSCLEKPLMKVIAWRACRESDDVVAWRACSDWKKALSRRSVSSCLDEHVFEIGAQQIPYSKLHLINSLKTIDSLNFLCTYRILDYLV